MSIFTNRISTLRSNFETLKTQKEMIEQSIAQYDKDMACTKQQMEVCDKSAILINNISTEAKMKVTAILEDMVTDAIKVISDGQYEFKILIEDTPKGNRCEFYIAENVDGEISLQKPSDSCGGGFVDIISTTLRYVYLNVFKDPVMKGPIILDEPAKMLSSEMSNKFGEFIKKLGEDFNRQTIMITHNDVIGSVADNNIDLRKVQ